MKRSENVSGVFPEFLPESASLTGGMAHTSKPPSFIAHLVGVSPIVPQVRDFVRSAVERSGSHRQYSTALRRAAVALRPRVSVVHSVSHGVKNQKNSRRLRLCVIFWKPSVVTQPIAANIPPCSSAERLFAEKNGGRRGKISVVDMVFLVFIGFLYLPPTWKVSL